jgi:hypothetical protein
MPVTASHASPILQPRGGRCCSTARRPVSSTPASTSAMDSDSGDYRKSDDYRRRVSANKSEPFAMSPHAVQPDRGRVRPGLGALAALLGTPLACWALRRAGLRWDAVRFGASALCVGQALCHPYARSGSWFATARPDRPNGVAENIVLSAFVGYLAYDQWMLGTRNLSMVAHHVFTAGVYGFCTLTGRALHMGRFILINESVSGLNALRRLGLLSGRTVREHRQRATDRDRARS